VRDRVQREAASPFGGVVPEEQRHDAVADLVQDDCQEQAGEEDEALFDLGAQCRSPVAVAGSGSCAPAGIELSGGATRS
jgi:hypothetical protein